MNLEDIKKFMKDLGCGILAIGYALKKGRNKLLIHKYFLGI
jgi:hypothetical protein